MPKSFDPDVVRAATVGPIQVTIPAKAAFDIDAFFDVQRSVFERMGHPACYSGADIRFMLEREFVIGEDLRFQQ